MAANKNILNKEVAYKPNTTAVENLPFPIVLYPGHYGAFFGFRQTYDSQITLCSCAREAITNYVAFREAEGLRRYADPTKAFILSSSDFPRALVEQLIGENAPNTSEVVRLLRFERGLCHECNGAVPSYRYCVEMYGGAFKQNFGWYIKKQAYEFGVEPLSFRTIPDVCPTEILQLITLDPTQTQRRYQELLTVNREEADRLYKELQKQKRRVWNFIEDEVRQRFGHRKVGESWTTETILYDIVRSLFPDKTVLRHYRPDFLQGLELDVFVEELKVGIEYQGIQHFRPVKHWGGKKGLQKLKERDKKKREICKKLGIHLVYFRYDQGLSNDFVSARIKEEIERQ